MAQQPNQHQQTRMSDRHRRELEAALIAALLLLYRHWTLLTLVFLGRVAKERSIQLSPSANALINPYAYQIAESIQAGINKQIAAHPDATLDEIRASIQAYNDATLIPTLESWVKHTAIVQTMETTPDYATGKSALDATDWEWQQQDFFEDECQDAADASPAPYAELVAITGGPPPRHRNCGCSLLPVGWTG